MPPEAGRGLGTEDRAHICRAGLVTWVLAEMSRLLPAVSQTPLARRHPPQNATPLIHRAGGGGGQL